MKFFICCFPVLMMGAAAHAQLKTTPVCPPLSVDVLGGNVNKLYPKSTLGEIQKALPCYSEIVEASGTTCAGIFYKDQGIYFYPERNYFEIRENFKGKMTLAIGTPRSSLFALLGNPKLKDVTWDAFQTEYGTLILYYDKANKVNKMQITSKSTDSIKLCE